MANIVKQILSRPIQLADQVTKGVDDVHISFKQDCVEIKAKTEKLAALLRQAARASNDLYERPTRRIIDDTEELLEKALVLVDRCSGNGCIKRFFTIIPNGSFRKITMQLENSIGNVSWLLRVSAPSADRDDEYLGLPPIASNEPILCLIWEQIAILYTGSVEDRSDAAASLVSLARDNDRYGKLIVEEGGVAPLLKLLKEGHMEGQEHAARAIGLLGRDVESAEQIQNAGVCAVFAKILKDGQMKVQLVVAWAVSELAANYPKCQDHFAQNNVIRLLVSHLAYETVQEHSKYTIPAKQNLSIHSMVMANNRGEETEFDKVPQIPTASPDRIPSVATNTMTVKIPKSNSDMKSGSMHAKSARLQRNQQNPDRVTLNGRSAKRREYEDPATKAQMKATAARALWQLLKGNLAVCRNITESRALLCFAILLEKGTEDVRYYSAMALMEITAMAEQYPELRRSAFKPTSPTAKAVVDQLLRVTEKLDDIELLIPCIRAIGSLARTFRATETRIIGPLVRLIDEKEPEVMMEAVVALNKFACTENFLHVNHCKSIIDHGGVKHLIQLVYFGEQMIQRPSLRLLCYITLHVPDSETLAKEEVLIVLEWSSKQAHLYDEASVRDLLPEAKSRLELYQSRGSRGFY